MSGEKKSSSNPIVSLCISYNSSVTLFSYLIPNLDLSPNIKSYNDFKWCLETCRNLENVGES